MLPHQKINLPNTWVYAMIQLDHLVIGARTLKEGRDYLENLFQTELAPGGQHLGFGTHNQLLKLGPSSYLELIALDPAQLAPENKPLFGLSSASVKQQLEHGPQLIAWVARTDNMANLPPDIGTPTLMKRDQLQWHITHRVDGQANASYRPAVIDWRNASHPCSRLPDSPVSLDSLCVATDTATQTWLTEHLQDPLIKLASSDTRLPQGSKLTARFALRLGHSPIKFIQMESV
jgi:Glyoxalase-like domain